MSFSPKVWRLDQEAQQFALLYFLTWKLLLLQSNTIFEIKVLLFHYGSFVFTADINITFETFSFSNQLSDVDLNIPYWSGKQVPKCEVTQLQKET